MTTVFLDDEAATLDFARQFSQALVPPAIIYLKGDLGAGKTTLVRGVVQAMGWKGAVKSPTYGLVESYQLGAVSLFHFDLYRLASPEELEWVGIRDYLAENGVWYVEWPERGAGYLPEPDLVMTLEYQPHGRNLCVTAITAKGRKIVSNIN